MFQERKRKAGKETAVYFLRPFAGRYHGLSLNNSNKEINDVKKRIRSIFKIIFDEFWAVFYFET